MAIVDALKVSCRHLSQESCISGHIHLPTQLDLTLLTMVLFRSVAREPPPSHSSKMIVHRLTH